MHVNKQKRRLLQHIADYIATGSQQAALDAKCPHVAAVVCAFRNDDNVATTTFALRAQYALGLLKTFIDECEGPSFARAIRFELLKAHTSELSQIDLGIGDDDKSWDSTWARVVAMVEPGLISRLAAEKTAAVAMRRRPGSAPIQGDDVVLEGEDSSKPVTLMSTTDLYRISSSLSLMKVQYVKSALQAEVWKAYIDSSAEWAAKVMIRSEASRSTIVAADNGIPKGTDFPFAGEVVVSIVKKDVFFLGELEGIKFYLSAGVHSSIDGDCAVVPWLAKTAKAERHNCEIVERDLSLAMLEDQERQPKFVLPFLRTTCAVAANAEVLRPTSTADMTAGVLNERKRPRSSVDSSSKQSPANSKRVKRFKHLTA